MLDRAERLGILPTSLHWMRTNFEQEIKQLQDTAIVMAEIQRRQADVQKLQAENVIYMQESMRVHVQRMDYIDIRLAEVTDKLGGLIASRSNVATSSR
jgi:hypothetical protein